LILIRLLAVVWIWLVSPGGDFARAHAPLQETNRDGVVHDEFFSGAVQDLTETSVSVCRSIPGKSPETRVFTIDGETIVEGKLKKMVRVTVGYRTHDGHDHAWRIIVRDAAE